MYKGFKGYKAIILHTLDADPDRWWKSWELQQVHTPYGWIGSRGSRDCRDLAKKGLIQVSHDRSEYAEYRSMELPPPESVSSKYAVEHIGSPHCLTLPLA